MGKFEVNFKENYVRLSADKTPIYIVSEELFPGSSHAACRLFEYAFKMGELNLSRKLNGMIND